jgi:hypothetical protein
VLLTDDRLSHADITRVAASNAAALRVLRVSELHQASVVPLLTAAPGLEALEADVMTFNLPKAHEMLRNKAPYGPLRMWKLCVHMERGEADTAAMCALAEDLVSHAALQELMLSCDDAGVTTSAPWLDAIVDAALTRRLRGTMFIDTPFTPASVPALARLVGGGALTRLTIYRTNAFLDETAAALLCDALRANTHFSKLSLHDTHLWRVPAAGAAVIRALVAHPSLHTLHLRFETPDSEAGKAAAGAALGALVAANSPALRTLCLFQCQLSDAGLAPVFAALHVNTHLRSLNCQYSAVSEPFMRDAVLPAVRANAGLRTLHFWGERGVNWPSARHAEIIVNYRDRQQG